MINTFFKSFLVVLGLTLSAQAQLTPAERQAQELSPEVQKIIAESSPLDRWVTKEQFRQIVKDMTAKDETFNEQPERTIFIDTRDQRGCFEVYSELQAKGWPVDKSFCEQDSSKPRMAIKLGVKLIDCAENTMLPGMSLMQNKCAHPYLNIKWRW